MPRNFMNVILNRPSQSYAAPQQQNNPPSSASATGSVNKRSQPAASSQWKPPTDLPNAPQAPSSLLAGGSVKAKHASKRSSGLFGPSTTYSASSAPPRAPASVAPSIADSSASHARPRFGGSGSKKAAHNRQSTDMSSNFGDDSMSIAPSNATMTPSKKKRWWDSGSLRGFGKGKSRAGSIAGDSIFSEPERNGPSGMAGIGAANTTPRKGTRSDFGSVPPSQYMPPMPPFDPNRHKAPSTTGSMGRLSSGVAPLGQQAPSLTGNAPRKPAKSEARASIAPVAPSTGAARRAMSQSDGGWEAFTQAMEKRDVGKSWAKPAGIVANENAVERRKSMVDRVKKELEDDAQADQVMRDPGVIRGDLLARATSVVGGMQSQSESMEPMPAASTYAAPPTNIRPGSIVDPAALQGLPESSGPFQPSSSASQYQQASQTQPQAVSPTPHHRQLADPQFSHQTQSYQDHQQLQPTQSAAPEPTQEMSEEENGSSEEDESSYEEHNTLDAVAEEDEEASEGHHEMKAGVRPMYTTRAPPRQANMSPESSVGSVDGQKVGETTAPWMPSIAEQAFQPAEYSGIYTHPSIFPSAAPQQWTGTAESMPISTVAHEAPPPPVAKDFRAEPQSVQPDILVSSASAQHARAASEDVATDADAANLGLSPALSQHKSDGDLRDGHHSGQSDYTSAEEEDSDDEDSSKSDSSSEDEFDETGEESGKDGEILAPRELQSARPDSAKTTVKFEGAGEESQDAITVGNGKARAIDQVADGQLEEVLDSDAESHASDATARKPTSISLPRAGSVRSSRAPSTLQRRLSDLSLGTSFAFSHFMGSKMTGRSSSRRIKLSDDDSDSDGEEDSGDDEDLKRLAAAEQDRLRNMPVGEDFFGGSLNDVLAQFDMMDFSDQTLKDTAALAEKARDDGISQEETARAQVEAQQIVSEVRRRRAGGEDVDHKTVRSEAGGLASSFAAIWLLNQTDENSSVQEPAKQPEAPVLATPAPVKVAAPAAAPVEAPPEPFADDDDTPRKKAYGIMDRPRFKARRPEMMGGFAISQGKLKAEAPYDPNADRRSTLPGKMALSLAYPVSSAASVMSGDSSEPQSPVGRKSLDLGMYKRSKDKPPPAKSALKAKSVQGLRRPKSLADTLLNFSSPKSSPAKKEVKEGRRARSGSTEERASMERSRKYNKEKTTDRPAMPPLPQRSSSMDGVGIIPSDGDAARSYAPAEAESQQSAGEPIAEADLPASANQVTVSNAEDVTEPTLPSEAAVAEAVQPELVSAPPVSHDQQTPIASQQGADASSERVPDSNSRMGDEQMTNEGVAAAQPEIEEPPSDSGPHGERIALPPPPSFAAPEASSVYQDARQSEVYTPGTQATAPSVGINLIPPTPPAYDLPTPQGQLAPPILGVDPSRPGLIRSKSSGSRKSDGSRRSSARKSALVESSENGLILPGGLTATTVAMSSNGGSMKRKKSTKSASRPASMVAAAPMPTYAAPVAPAGLPPPHKLTDMTAVDPTTSPSRPIPPPKDHHPKDQQPSRQYGGASPRFPGPQGHPLSGSASPIMVQRALGQYDISPAGSSANSSSNSSPDGDISRSLTSRTSSSAQSMGAAGASNAAGVEPEDGHYQRRAVRVRTQNTPNAALARRTQPMGAISEWATSPIDGSNSPAGYEPSPTQSNNALDQIPGGSSVGHGSYAHGYAESAGYPRDFSTSGSVEGHLHPPVPRSRLTTDEGAAFRRSSLASYAASADGHGFGYAMSPPQSLDGHSNYQHGYQVARPMSEMSGFSMASSVPQSVASLPQVPRSVASYRPADARKALTSSTVDDRLYERSTMATVSVTTGAFAKMARKHGGASAPGGQRTSTDGGRPSMDLPAHLVDEMGVTSMSVTAHTPPPRKVGSHQVLVQVITVAIDQMDRMLLRDKVRSDTAYGWVPGRSFCGRVLEAGWEAKRLKKGDMVFGLQSNRKCGALAEFMTVDEDLVAKAPEDCLTVDQIAALPAAGVLAFQIMRNYCTYQPKGARILVLNAHDGIGLLTMQECAELGLVMVAQCPASVNDGLAVCEANGAHEVVVGEPLWAMNTLHESSFDLVIDTIGGRRLYDAARRILASHGQYVTCFGDEHSSANPNFKSHLRSIRRTFFKKDKKNIGYEWIGLENSEDCKEALEAVRRAAENGEICPRLRSILPLADAPRAFDPVTRGAEEEPGAVVVRVQ